MRKKAARTSGSAKRDPPVQLSPTGQSERAGGSLDHTALVIADFEQTRTDLRSNEDAQMSVQRLSVSVSAFVAVAGGVLMEQDTSVLPLVATVPLVYFGLAAVSLRLFLQHDRLRAYSWVYLPRLVRHLGANPGVWSIHDHQTGHVAELKSSDTILKRFPLLILPILYCGVSIVPGMACVAASAYILDADPPEAVEGGVAVAISAWLIMSTVAFCVLTYGVCKVRSIRLKVMRRAAEWPIDGTAVSVQAAR